MSDLYISWVVSYRRASCLVVLLHSGHRFDPSLVDRELPLQVGRLGLEALDLDVGFEQGAPELLNLGAKHEGARSPAGRPSACQGRPRGWRSRP